MYTLLGLSTNDELSPTFYDGLYVFVHFNSMIDKFKRIIYFFKLNLIVYLQLFGMDRFFVANTQLIELLCTEIRECTRTIFVVGIQCFHLILPECPIFRFFSHVPFDVCAGHKKITNLSYFVCINIKTFKNSDYKYK